MQNNCSEFLKHLVDWQGYMTLNEVEYLQKTVQMVNTWMNPVFVNIGAGAGTSTIAMAIANISATVFSVDIRADEFEMFTNEHLRLKEISEEVSNRVIRIWGDSKQVGRAFPYNVDLVFVDGDHEKDGITGDIESWFDKINPGGIICFHDYGSVNWPHVKLVVDNISENLKWQKLFEIDTFVSFKIFKRELKKVEYQ